MAIIVGVDCLVLSLLATVFPDDAIVFLLLFFFWGGGGVFPFEQELVVAYGMTESSPITFCGYASDPVDVRCDSVGYPADHTEVRKLRPRTSQSPAWKTSAVPSKKKKWSP